MRFPGFDDEWKTKKLGEICEINPKSPNLPNSFIYIDLESVVNGVLLKEDRIIKSESPSRAQRLLKNNDILFQMVRPYQKNNLFFDKTGDYVASTGYAQVRTEQNPQFIFQYLHHQKFVNEVIEKCTGTSYPAINSTDLSNIYIQIPTTIEEQSKVADFLSLCETRIHCQNKIIQNLESEIRIIREKLFKQQIRFKDENRNDFPDWEVKTLGEIANIRSGLSRAQNNNVDGYKVTRIETISNGEINVEKVGFIDVVDDIDEYKLQKGDILFSNINSVSHIGKTAIAFSDLDIYHGMNLLCIKTKSNTYPSFLFFYLNTDELRNYFKTICNQAVSQASINQSELAKTKIFLPCFAEQIVIADFLSIITNKVETEKKILEQYKNQKAYLLQNLFI